MDIVYENQPLDLELVSDTDLSDASLVRVDYEFNDTSDSWDATLADDNITVTASIDANTLVVGRYICCVVAVTDDGEVPSTPFIFDVVKKFS